jgi:F-type H+-transporting ATPase subunit c
MTNLALSFLSAGIGAGLSVLGVGVGIGRLAASALDATGRQPAATNDIRTTMLIAAALIEGVGLLGLVVAILLVTKT